MAPDPAPVDFSLLSREFQIGGHHLRGITPDEVLIGVPFTERLRTVAARTMVLVSYPHPNRELAELLAEQHEGRPVHLIGDVTGTNGILPAIHQAVQVTRAI